MQKYTANYAYTNPNFVIQNLDDSSTNEDLKPLLYVLKNLLQRGFPTVMSHYLQEQIGQIHTMEDFEDRFLFATNQAPQWHGTIKGDAANNYNPARIFFEQIIPNEFKDYSFVQSLIVPEIAINDITGQYNKDFIHQQVDFYLPQAKLVIEIDGQQHKLNDTQRLSDNIRDNYLRSFQIETIRITTEELNNGSYKRKIEQISSRISQFANLFRYYRKAYDKIEKNLISREEKERKLLPTAIIRFQILLTELLLHNRLCIGSNWKFNIRTDEDLGRFAQLAIEDTLIWLNALYKLKNKREIARPTVQVNISTNDDFIFDENAINIDFSLCKRWTDENELNPNIIYVRTDYFDIIKDKNYFKVSTAESINYHITDDDKPTLRFFLQNIFNKDNFRDGQFPIIANALNLNDTIGLLPTGGGKSLCYQLPCLLQPSVNFVVCPIKSLMYDQAENLRRNGVLITNTNYICGDQSVERKEKVLKEYAQGHYLFIWISPERFQIPSFRNSISSIVSNLSISYAVIDEVHCLSEWGHDFRTSYLNLAKTIDKLSPKDEYGEGKVKFIGLTATASVNVLKDIRIEFSRQKQTLEDENIKSLLEYSRSELVFEVIDDNGRKFDKLVDLLEQHNVGNEADKASLIFTPFVNGDVGCYRLSNQLSNKYPGKVAWYSGSSPKEQGTPVMQDAAFNQYKEKVQNNFKNDSYRILCATKAFGMGIDKQNIFYTYHYGLPSSVESLYQEAGRAGRWDKSKEENRNKQAFCYILHSKEPPQYTEYVEKIFSMDSSFSDIQEIMGTVGKENGRDIFKQLFLFSQNRHDIPTEYKNIINVVDTFFEENREISISYKDIHQLNIAPDSFEKIIYRLSLLGVVEDWTRDFIQNFTVRFNTLNDERVIGSIAGYINKYEPDNDVSASIENVDQPDVDTKFEKAVWYLLEWIFRHIVYNRKQSLKTLSDWCCEFEDSSSFKKRLDSYFTFNDTTFVLQYIAEHPDDFTKWFEVFFSDGQFKTDGEIKKLRDSVSRFLESYSNNAGLNFISGLIRLKLDQYSDKDGQSRFENSLLHIKEKFNDDKRNQVIGKLQAFIKDNFSPEQQFCFGCSLLKFYPELKERLADYFNQPIFMQEVIERKIKELHNLNIRLYERLSKF